MLKGLVQRLLRLKRQQAAFDPSQFGDPVAVQTDWTPARRGGANFQTRKLVEANANRLEFRASRGAKLFYLVFLLSGVGIAFGFSFQRLSSGVFSFDTDTIVSLAVGLIFAITGIFLLYFGATPVVFDKIHGAFWKGRKTPEPVVDSRPLKRYCELHRIHALQLISEYVRGNKNSYYSYELNLVLEDGSRINVVDHGNKNRLREDARTLSAFLDKPVWDAI